MINNMINAKTARQMSFENGGSGKRALNILDKVQDCIRKTCQEGKYEVEYLMYDVDSDVGNSVLAGLRDLGFAVALNSSGNIHTLYIKW